MIPPGYGRPEKPKPATRKKPKKAAKPACRCEPTPAAKKAAATKKTAKAASRGVPRAARVGKLGGLAFAGPPGRKAIAKRLGSAAPAKHHQAAAKAKKKQGRPAALRAGGAKARNAATVPPTHGKAETHCQCKKTSTPRPRGLTPRR